MKLISLQQTLSWLTHATLHSSAHTSLNKTSYGVNTDTRTLRANNLFVALKGERFDGHRFIGFAARNQAAAAIVNFDSEELIKQATGEIPLIVVRDTNKALQELAQSYRRQFNLPLAVVIGSNGKTTVKEMVYSIFKNHLATQGNERAAHCTAGNFNNDIGLPLTLLRLNDHHKLSVIELGMNHSGETAQLAAIAAPTIAVINNAQREHQEFMHTVEAVAQEHASIIATLAINGTVVLPAQDSYIDMWRKEAATHNKQVIDFALHTELDKTPALVIGKLQTNSTVISEQTTNLSQTLLIQTPVGEATVLLNIAGEHHARNALAATAVALAADLPLSSIVAGLQAFEPVKGRMQQHRITIEGKVLNIIDDTYNANPDSVAAAISVLAQQTGRTVLVLGDMGEVGEQGTAFHSEAGLNAATQSISALYTVGNLSQNTHTAFKNSPQTSNKPAQHFNNTTDLQTFLLANALQTGDTVLIKGSRFMRMEFVLEALLGKNAGAIAAGGH